MTSVFLSHARTDHSLADAVASALSAAGVQLTSPENTVEAAGPSGNWAAAVERAIAEADLVIVLWSIASARSEWSQWEVKLAINAWAHDRLLLARADNAELPLGLRDIPAIDLASDRQRGIDEIVRGVRGTAGRTAAGSPESPPAFTVPMDRSLARAPRPAQRSRRRGSVLAGVLLGLAFIIGSSSYFYSPALRKASQETEASPLPDYRPPPRGAPRDRVVGASRDSVTPAVPAPSPGGKEATASSMLVIVAACGTLFGSLAVWMVIWLASRRRTRARLRASFEHYLPPRLPPRPSALHQVFVSYSRRDERLVHRLIEEIESSGLHVWIDRRIGASGALRYAAPIVAAIRSSRLVALMCSHNAFASDHVIRKVYVAGDFKKPFIAFELDDSEIPDELLYFLSGFPRIAAEPIDPSLIQSEITRFLA
jgi:hypothetical protein